MSQQPDRAALLKRIDTMLQSSDFCSMVRVQHVVAEDRGFHPKAGLQAPALKQLWQQRQLLHLCIEIGELADRFRKTATVDLEEAADVFIVLADLIGVTSDQAQLFRDTVVAKTLRNLARPKQYGLADED